MQDRLPIISFQDHALVGHAGPRTVMRQAIASSRTGTGQTVAIIGEAGIGKSSLCREAVDAAAQVGIPTFVGRTGDAGPPEPFRPLIEAFASGLRESGPPDDPGLLPYRGLLSHLLPTWANKPFPLPSLTALSEAVLRLLTVLARDSGAVLVLEDLHQADDDLLAVVEYLAANADAHGACFIATLRPDPPSAAMSLARRLADGRSASLIELEPLTADDVDTLILELLQTDAAPDELLAYVRTRADGIPFLVEELLVALIRCGAAVAGRHGWQLVPARLDQVSPPSPGELVAQRVRELSDRSRGVVAAAALLGPSVEWPLLTQITGSDEPTVLAALREATYAGLLSDDGTKLSFRHALTRQHVIRTLLPPERLSLAARAVGAITDHYPDLPGHWCDLGAELAELAGDRQRATELLMISAQRAFRAGALSTATARLERAIDQLDPADRSWAIAHRGLAEVRALAGDVDGALQAADTARNHPTDDDDVERIDVDLAVGRALLAAGRIADAEARAQQARDAASSRDQVRETQAMLLVADVAIAAQDLSMAQRLAAAVQARSPLETALHCEALELLGRCARVHDVDEAERLFTEELELAEDADLVVWRARALHEIGTIDLLDRMRTDRLREARRAGIEAGAPAIAAIADLHLAAALVAQGRPVEAREAAERSESLAARLGHSVAPWATMMIARTYAHERRADDAEAAITRALTVADDRALEAQAHGHVRAMLALHEADRRAAIVALDRAAELLRAVPGHHDPHRGLWALLRTLDGSDDDDARAEVAEAAGSGTRFNRALLTMADAVAAGRRGDHERAEEHYHLGHSILAGYERPAFITNLAVWLVAPAALADDWGHPVSDLQASLRWFADEGYGPLASSCRTLLREAGAAVPRRGRGRSTVPATLRAAGVTSREVDVLWLVADRMTNLGIAERLVLSPRTVEKHVAALLRKTGAADRRALATLAASLDTSETSTA